MSPLEEYPADRRLVVERVATGPDGTARAVVGAARALTEHGLAGDAWRLGDPPGHPEALTVPIVAAYLARMRQARARGEVAISAFTATPPPSAAAGASPLLLLLDSADTPGGPLETLRCTLPGPAPETDRMMALLGAVSAGFDAVHGHVEDDRLLLLYQSRRAAERAWAATPEPLRQYLPGSPPMPDDGVPDLLVPQEYDRRRVPAGVWWVNYWDAEQVATVGAARVRGAGWAALAAQGGGLLLAATEEPLDALRPAHARRLASLVAAVRLPELQRRHRYPDRTSTPGD